MLLKIQLHHVQKKLLNDRNVNVVQVSKIMTILLSLLIESMCVALQIQPPVPKIKKIKEVAPKLPDKTKWTMEEQKQFFSALRIV